MEDSQLNFANFKRKSKKKDSSVTRIIVIRHGETDWNVIHRLQGITDTHLTDIGIRQAERVAARLSRDNSIEKIYSSDLTRAMHTAKAIAQARTLVESEEHLVETDERLREFHLGIFAGHSHNEAQEKFPDEWTKHLDNDDFVIPGGESYTMFTERVKRVFRDIHGGNIGSSICVVTHGGVIDCIRHYLVTEDRCGPGRCRNASISEIIVRDDVWTLTKWNDVSHLAKLHAPVLAADDILKHGTDEDDDAAQ